MEDSVAQKIPELMKRIKEGDESAMTEFVVCFGPAMRRLASQLVGRDLRAKLDSDDIVQSVHITLWVGLRNEKFEVPTTESLVALVRTLLRRQVARQLRRAEAKKYTDASMVDTVTDQVLSPISKETDPHASLEFTDLMEKLLSQLDDVDQRLVRLRFRGFTTADAATLLKIDPGHLRVRLGRLRQRLTELGNRSDALQNLGS